jgi:diguanylate cyclase (GGDEF)-like protein
MISIRDSMTELEKLRAMQAAVFENYICLLRDVEQYAVEIDEEVTGAHRRHLSAIAIELKQQSGTEELSGARGILRNELRDYQQRAGAILARLRRDLSDKVDALQAIVEAMASADGDHENRLQSAIEKLHKLSQNPAAAPIRTALAEASAAIENSVDELKKQNGLTVGQFIVEIKTLHNRIETLETAGRKDVLTGLISRVEMENRLAAEIDGRRNFSLLMLRIDNLPMIQRQFGQAVRADVVSAFAQRMRGGLPQDSRIGRWSEDEFAVLLQMEKSHAMLLAKKLKQHVAGPYVCMQNGKPQRPSLVVNVAVIDHSLNGTYESLISRLSQF